MWYVWFSLTHTEYAGIAVNLTATFYFFLQIPLGSYPEERFDEPAIDEMVKKFQTELSLLSQEIATRNAPLELPYTYLDPSAIESSITI